jgi:benzil reductase ((S)-benzoin forming)
MQALHVFGSYRKAHNIIYRSTVLVCKTKARTMSAQTSAPPPSLALVTGGRSGIGKAIVEKIATFRFIEHVLVVSRSVQEESSSSGSNTGKFIPVAADIGTPEGRRKIAQQVSKLNLPLRFLVHSAGTIDPIKPILDITEADFEKSVQTNLQGPVLLTTALYPFMANDDDYCAGRVLHVSSGAAHGPPPVGWSLYGITKAGFFQAFKTLDKEFCHLGGKVRVGSFKPGIVDTDMQGTIRKADEKDMPMVSAFHGFKENIKGEDVFFKARPPPAGALDRPENVACFAEWLLLGTTDDEFANVDDPSKYDIRNAELFHKWIPPENLPKVG